MKESLILIAIRICKDKFGLIFSNKLWKIVKRKNKFKNQMKLKN
jgi:hypothetical protein